MAEKLLRIFVNNGTFSEQTCLLNTRCNLRYVASGPDVVIVLCTLPLWCISLNYQMWCNDLFLLRHYVVFYAFRFVYRRFANSTFEIFVVTVHFVYLYPNLMLAQAGRN